MTIKEMRSLPADEITTQIKKARDQVFKLRFQGKGKDLEKPGEYKALKKSIARMLTVQSERAIASQGGKG